MGVMSGARPNNDYDFSVSTALNFFYTFGQRFARVHQELLGTLDPALHDGLVGEVMKRTVKPDFKADSSLCATFSAPPSWIK